MQQTINIENPTQKQYWIANLRVLATIAVVFIHTAGGALVNFGKIPATTWWYANVISGFGRFTVPVFVMISGALLLGKDIELFAFLKKRFLRVWLPFTVWVIIYIGYHNIFEQNTIGFKNAFLGYLSGGKGQYGHLWFVYMILGLYLFTPIINHFILKATNVEIKYLLILSFVSTSVFLFLHQFLALKIRLDIGNFGGYLCYFVAGYFLNKIHTSLNRFWLGLLFLVGYLITIFGTFWLSNNSGKYAGYFYDYFSFSTVAMSISIFLFFKKAFNQSFLPKIMEPLDRASFGIYLAHLLIINILSRKMAINWAWHPPFIGIVSHACLTILISFIIVWTLSRLPFGKWLVG